MTRFVRIRDRQSQFCGQRVLVLEALTDGSVRVLVCGTVGIWFVVGEYEPA